MAATNPPPGPTSRPADGLTTRNVDPQAHSLLVGVSAVRWATIVWAAVVLAIDAGDGILASNIGAVAMMVLVAAWSVATTIWVATDSARLASWLTLGTDLVVAAALYVANALLYDGAAAQSFGSAWPLTSVFIVGVCRGRIAGLLSGLGLGVVNVVARGATDPATGSEWLGTAGTAVLLALGGWAAGFVAHKLRQAELAVAEARMREAFARTLHDGVLQTLAAVQRRSDDPRLVDLARDQELELRRFVSGDFAAAPTDLLAAMRDAVRAVEQRDGVRCQVVVIDAPTLPAGSVAALAAATAEAVTNAAKHGGAEAVTVCLDRDGGGATVTVKDDGAGFDPSSTTEGIGWTRSIRGRLAEVGGRADVRSTPGGGCEVTLWVP